MPDVALAPVTFAGRRERSARQLWALPHGSHDRLVRALSFLLPVAVGILAAFLVMAPIYSGGDVSFVLDKNKVEVARERLKIQAATYRGQDTQGQPFTLNAGSAVQRTSAEPIVELNRLDAHIQLTDGPARLHANKGRYDMDSQRVHIDGPVRFQAANGYDLLTRDATVDLKSRQLESTGAATGTIPQGDFRADRLSADLETRVVKLDGHAHLRFTPGKPK